MYRNLFVPVDGSPLSERAMQASIDLARQLGAAFTGLHARNDGIDRAIIDQAETSGCDMIVMLTHGRGSFGELMFGSHTKNVLAKSKLPLLVLH